MLSLVVGVVVRAYLTARSVIIVVEQARFKFYQFEKLPMRGAFVDSR